MTTGCSKQERSPAPDDTTAAVFTPPRMAPPTPIEGQGHDTPLTAYIGHYPRDAVDGVSFFDRTEVANSLISAVGDPKLRHMITGRAGVTVPIFRYDGKIAAHGCEPHNCDAHNWTFLMAADGSGATACFHDAAAMGNTSRWYSNDAPVSRAGACPQV
ncbi:MAG: hypothetical protein OSB00_13745 [Sphingomonas bacterium]|nr:hypothetical protein [Sphingomonas bacterium]